ncbi:hypothetical protein Dimus_023882 [Dionaea muscipula]
MLNLCSNGVRGSTLLLHPRTLVRPRSASTALIAYGSDLSEGYLVNNPALSRGAASTPTLTKVPVCRSSEKKNNPNLAIDFLKEIGLDNSQVEKIANSRPRLLRFNVEKTLIPKIRVLQDFGFCGTELISLIASNPSLLQNVSRNSLLAKLDFLKSILGSVENARNAIIKKANWLLSASLTKALQPNFELLKSYESLVRVEQELGIPRESGMFLYGFKVMVSLSKRDLELRFEMFKRYGWSESGVRVMAKRMPPVLSTSEAKLKTGVDFFINKLGYEIGYLVAYPSLLTYSMENRILRRYAVVQDNLPELYEAYAGGKKSVDSSVQKEKAKQ